MVGINFGRSTLSNTAVVSGAPFRNPTYSRTPASACARADPHRRTAQCRFTHLCTNATSRGVMRGAQSVHKRADARPPCSPFNGASRGSRGQCDYLAHRMTHKFPLQRGLPEFPGAIPTDSEISDKAFALQRGLPEFPGAITSRVIISPISRSLQRASRSSRGQWPGRTCGPPSPQPFNGASRSSRGQ